MFSRFSQLRHRRSWRKAAALVVAVLAVQIVTAVPGAAPAGAAIGPGEDRQKATPTSWWYYHGISAATVSSKLSANGARLTDIKYEGNDKYTVAMVKNSGSYATSWWWYHGVTEAQVNSYATQNNARPIAIQGYNTGSGIRFAVIMVANTGSNAESWSWYYGTTSFISSHITSSKRMVSFGRIQGTSYYTAIFGSNTGTNATGWWWYYGQTTAQLTSLLSTNGARLIDLDRNNDTGTYNAVMYQTSGTNWHWYYGYSASALLEKANQLGNRIFDVTPYTVGSTKYFAAVMVDNLGSSSRTLRAIIEPKVDSGAYGFYVKQVGGSTLAGLQYTKQYEPASALKVLYHAKSIRSEALGNTTDNTSISYNYNPADSTNGGICPDDYSSFSSTTILKNADTQMMRVSDNRMTKGILYKYGGGTFAGGKTAMENYAATLGMTQTKINHNIGCPTAATYNRTTLQDLGKVYEAYQNGVITSSSTWKSQFRSRMLTESSWSGFESLICPVVAEEATKLGKSATVATNFCNAMTFMAKGGSYQYGGSLPYTVSWDDVWLTKVPYKSRGVITPKYFVTGVFVDQTQINSNSESTNVSDAMTKVKAEALRPYIKAALQSGW